MIGAVVTVVVGLMIWKIIPLCIEYGSRRIRRNVKLICNILGVMLVIVGVYRLVASLLASLGISF